MKLLRLFLTLTCVLLTNSAVAQSDEVRPDDSVLLFVSETKIPFGNAFADLCLEEPYMGVGAPYYVLTLDRCSGSYDYIYLETDDIAQAQTEGLIDPALPSVAVWPEDARSRLSIAWLDIKDMFQTDDRPTNVVGEGSALHGIVSSVFEDLGLPEPGPGTMMLVLLVVGFLTMRRGAMRIVSALMWIATRFRRKGAGVAAPGVDAPVPNARLAEAALGVMATAATVNGYYNEAAMPVITEQYTAITGQAPSSSALSKLFAEDQPPVNPAKIGRKLNKPQRIQLLSAGYAVAKADGPLTPEEFGFLKSLSDAMKVRMPRPQSYTAA